jgi:hypothetical protein
VDAKGQSVFLLGGQPSKYRENFERKFNEAAHAVELALVETRDDVGAIPSAAHGRAC